MIEHPEAEQTIIETLYPYQQSDLDTIFDRISNNPINYRLLYQLPTGGGKTVVFSEIVKRFTELTGKKAIVLTHRNELCLQTSRTLTARGVVNKRITSSLKHLPVINKYACYVAMVETLKNRLKERAIFVDDIGLVIIDEAHHNSFGKLLDRFKNAFIIGVTATPLSSDASLPMKKTYNELISGETISNLIQKGFLAKAETYVYDVELHSLKMGTTGDFTVRSSDELYATEAMLSLLLKAYEEKAKGKKTLIFNTGIFTSKQVVQFFEKAGYQIRHLDNKNSASERTEILKWFRKTPRAILTSVSLLTTGFDEPGVQCIIMNRATKSMTLYFQMVGRGSRVTTKKKKFIVIDLGNNIARFGLWNEPLDWQHVFSTPQNYLENRNANESQNIYIMPASLRALFPKSREVAFDIIEHYRLAIENGMKPKTVIRDSIRQHAFMCIENSDSISDARELVKALEPDIVFRAKLYTQCLDKTSKTYKDWLIEDYQNRLNILIGKIFNKFQSQNLSAFKKV